MRNPFLSVLIQPFISLPLPPKGVFAGKTALVTGGNTGLGLEAARHILKSGGKHVILGVRSVSKGEAARESLLATRGVPTDANVEVWFVDLMSFESVKAFAARAKGLDHLDYVFLNAGLGTLTFKHSEDGWETTLQVNVLSTALIGLLVLPKLVSQARAGEGNRDKPHMVITASGLHAMTAFKQKNALNSLKELNTEQCFRGHDSPMEQYMVTKLFNVYITHQLSELVPTGSDGNPEVIVTSVDPGLCKSELQREGPLPFPVNIMLRFCGYTTEYGSRNLIAAALGSADTHGWYFADGHTMKSGGLSVGAEGKILEEKVWGEIVGELRLVTPEIDSVLNSDF